MHARQLPARTGFAWLKSSFVLYRRNPPLLTSVTMAYLVLLLGLSLIPLVDSIVVPVITPFLALALANTCRSIDEGQPLTRERFVLGISENRVSLFYIGVFQLAASAVMRALSYLLEGGPVPMPDADQIDFAQVARVMVLALPILIAVWFAPMLAGWNKVPPAKALFFSFVASLQNWRAFLVYGVAIFLAAVIVPGLLMVVIGALASGLGGAITFALQLLLIMVLVPVLMAASYVTYQDIFAPREFTDE